MTKTHPSVWITIGLSVLSMLFGAVIYITTMNARLNALEDRVNNVIKFCCEEINRTETQKVLGGQYFSEGGGAYASQKGERRLEVGE